MLSSGALYFCGTPLLSTGCLGGPTVSILTKKQALPSQGLTGVTQLHCGIYWGFFKLLYFVGKCDITRTSSHYKSIQTI